MQWRMLFASDARLNRSSSPTLSAPCRTCSPLCTSLLLTSRDFGLHAPWHPSQSPHPRRTVSHLACLPHAPPPLFFPAILRLVLPVQGYPQEDQPSSPLLNSVEGGDPTDSANKAVKTQASPHPALPVCLYVQGSTLEAYIAALCGLPSVHGCNSLSLHPRLTCA